LSKIDISDNFSISQIQGTLEYACPEMLQRRGYGKAADWWGIGILMYEAIFKVTPFYD